MLTNRKLLFRSFLKCMYLQFAHLELRIQWWNCVIQAFRVKILQCLVNRKLLFLKCMYLQFAHLELRIQWWNCVIQMFRANILQCLV